MRVLYLPEYDNETEWFEGVLKACHDEHEVILFKHSAPMAEQFTGIECVVDQGGSVGTREMMNFGREQGVKFWQILGTGLDHVDVAYLLECGFLVANCPGMFSSIALAEHALFLALYLAKCFPSTQKIISENRQYTLLVGELYGHTLGLIGFAALLPEALSAS